jgi:hypothetical protein
VRVILELLLTQITLEHERLAFTIALRLLLLDFDQDLVETLAKHTTIIQFVLTAFNYI